MKIIDTHSHFNLLQFDADRADAISRMQKAEVATICVGIDEDTSREAVALAQRHRDIWATVGQHPTETDKAFDHEHMKKLALEKRVVGVGECGLDYFRERDRAKKDEQHELFIQHIRLANELDLPLVLHIRPQQNTMDAYEDALLLIEEWRRMWPTMRGTAHFFVGNQEVARRFLDLGFHISFSGVITIFSEYEELVRFVPLERILPETDAPFASPLPYRGKRNEPAYVLEVTKRIAELKGVALKDAEQQLLKNANILFNLGI